MCNYRRCFSRVRYQEYHHILFVLFYSYYYCKDRIPVLILTLSLAIWHPRIFIINPSRCMVNNVKCWGSSGITLTSRPARRSAFSLAKEVCFLVFTALEIQTSFCITCHVKRVRKLPGLIILSLDIWTLCSRSNIFCYYLHISLLPKSLSRSNSRITEVIFIRFGI